MKHIKIYNDEEKIAILQEFYASGLTKDAFQRERGMGHCTLSKWISNFGFGKDTNRIKLESMGKKEPISLRVKLLEEENARLQELLRKAELKSLAYSTMIDVAEEQFNIPIRKKAGAKQ